MMTFAPFSIRCALGQAESMLESSKNDRTLSTEAKSWSVPRASLSKLDDCLESGVFIRAARTGRCLGCSHRSLLPFV